MFWTNIAKMISTVAMWLLIGLISIFAITQGTANSGDTVPLVLGSLFFGLVGTFIIWVAPDLAKNEHRDEQSSSLSEKNKRRQGDKLSILLELMDEDERAAFKDGLKRQLMNDMRYDDGEQPYSGETLETLMDEERQQRR